MDTQTQSMPPLVEFTPLLQTSELPMSSPIQFLVIDKIGGPAEILVDVFGKLFDFGVSFTLVSTADDVWYALHCYKFDLLVVGLENHILESLALIPDIRKDYPDLPVLGIGHHLSLFHVTQSQQFGLDHIVELPQRASELKSLLRALVQRYLLER